VTQKGNTLYLHVFQWPDNGKLVVGGVYAKVEKAFLLADPQKKSLKWAALNNRDLVINLPEAAPDSLNSVIKLTYSSFLKTDSVRLLSSRQPNQLLVFDAVLHGDGYTFGDGKPNNEFVSNWKNKDQYLTWDFRLNEPVTFTVMLKYNTSKNDERGKIIADLDGVKYTISYEPVLRAGSLKVGQITMEAGIHHLKLTPGDYEGAQLMRPLSFKFIPVMK
jgi:hypothetical protein